MTETVTRYRMGADIPEWLIAVEPNRPESRKGTFRFATDVDVIETENYWLVIQIGYESLPEIVDGVGMSGCTIFAASKPVRIIRAFQTVLPMAPNVPMYETLYGAPLQPKPVPQEPPQSHQFGTGLNGQDRQTFDGLEVRNVPDPHRTFWQRLLYALRGR